MSYCKALERQKVYKLPIIANEKENNLTGQAREGHQVDH